MPKSKKKSSKRSLEIEKIFQAFDHKAFTLDVEKDILDRPIFSTTLYLATFNIKTHFGQFKTFIFQDIIHKGYVIALTYGDIYEKRPMYTRVHSSCVTSETLRGCDCDCVQQLEGALKKISEEGRGILFYLMQEGRGVGYVAKARDRMLVQSTKDEISTFDAYHIIGLKRDYRQYRNIKPICKLLNIDPEFILLTNNPDKVSTLTEEKVKIKKTEALEYDPSPYNLAYLQSKMESGHFLEKPEDSHFGRVEPPEKVVPFKPHALPNANRFIYVASYFLPIRPVDDEIILDQEQFNKFFNDKPIDHYIEMDPPALLDYTLLRNHRYRIKINQNFVSNLCEVGSHDSIFKIIHLPYWFRAHVYFDIVTGEDFVILTYGKPSEKDAPVVRVQSESLLNRFPLTDTYNKDKYNATLKKIMEYGSGIIVLLYNDGRGSGLGAYAEDLMYTEKGYSHSTEESYDKIGAPYDRRDYEAAMRLLKEHLPGNKVQMVMNSPSSLVKKSEYAEALNKHHIYVNSWIFLESNGNLNNDH